jgi:hypothetical protein
MVLKQAWSIKNYGYFGDVSGSTQDFHIQSMGFRGGSEGARTW